MISRGVQLVAKHALDKIASLGLVEACSPLLLSIAAAIKLEDGGPVFFRQERIGKDGRPFQIYKFRTMVVNADELLEKDGTVKVDRITKVGKLLRFTSLDELPQLFNILGGEMSIVGPRPVLRGHLDRYTEEQRRRLEVRPGITGLAQVNGRNTLPWSRRIEYDVEYVDRFSLVLDLEILFRTIKVVLLREGVALDRNPEQVDDLGEAR